MRGELFPTTKSLQIELRLANRMGRINFYGPIFHISL